MSPASLDCDREETLPEGKPNLFSSTPALNMASVPFQLLRQEWAILADSERAKSRGQRTLCPEPWQEEAETGEGHAGAACLLHPLTFHSLNSPPLFVHSKSHLTALQLLFLLCALNKALFLLKYEVSFQL